MPDAAPIPQYFHAPDAYFCGARLFSALFCGEAERLMRDY